MSAGNFVEKYFFRERYLFHHFRTFIEKNRQLCQSLSFGITNFIIRGHGVTFYWRLFSIYFCRGCRNYILRDNRIALMKISFFLEHLHFFSTFPEIQPYLFSLLSENLRRLTELHSTCPSELLDGKETFETKSFFVSSGISAKICLENCQKHVGDVLRVRREKFDEKHWKLFFPTVFWTFSQQSLVFCQKVSDRLFRTPFYMSIGTVWRKTIFFEKIKNFQSNSGHSTWNICPSNEIKLAGLSNLDSTCP